MLVAGHNEIYPENYGDARPFHLEDIEMLPDEPTKDGGKPIDWEQRRYEIAKNCLDMLSGLNSSELGRYDTIKMRVDLAITYADELIKQLKGE